jgi:hypothetical protein
VFLGAVGPKKQLPTVNRGQGAVLNSLNNAAGAKYCNR